MDAVYSTQPLFFMVELGKAPKLLENSPRYAGDLFKQFNFLQKVINEESFLDELKNELKNEHSFN